MDGACGRTAAPHGALVRLSPAASHLHRRDLPPARHSPSGRSASAGCASICTSPRAWLERLTEVAVIVALFVGGLKLRLPFRDPGVGGGMATRGADDARHHRVRGGRRALAARLPGAARRPARGHPGADRSGARVGRRGERRRRPRPDALRTVGRSRPQRRDGVPVRDLRADVEPRGGARRVDRGVAPAPRRLGDSGRRSRSASRSAGASAGSPSGSAPGIGTPRRRATSSRWR